MSHTNAIVNVFLSLVTLISACSDEKRTSVVVFSVAPGDGSTTPIYQLRATFANQGQMDSRFFPTRADQAISLPTSFSVTLPRTSTGALDVLVEGLEATGTPTVAGWTRVDIVPDRIVQTTVWLVSSMPPAPPECGMPGSDCDGGLPDIANDDTNAPPPNSSNADGGAEDSAEDDAAPSEDGP